MKNMMRHSRWTAPFSLALALLLSMPLQALAGTSQASLYQQSGLDQQFEHLWQQVDTEYQLLPKNRADSRIDLSVQMTIKNEFSENRIKESILEFWSQHLADADVQTITEWLDSSVGRKITQAEINASILADDQAFSQYMGSFKKNPPSKTRIDLLRLLDKAVRASAASTDMGIHINLAAVTAQHASGQAPADAESPSEQAKSLEKDRGFIRAMLRQEVLRFNLFTYRHINNSELRDYIRFAESASGASYHESTFFAVRDAMNKATLELQQQLQGQRQQTSRASLN